MLDIARLVLISALVAALCAACGGGGTRSPLDEAGAAPAGPTTGLAIVTQPTGTVGAGHPLLFQVMTVDDEGQRVSDSGVSVQLVPVPPLSGLVGGTTVQTDTGIANFLNVRVADILTGCQVRAVASGLPDVTSEPFDVVAGSATRFEVTPPQGGAAVQSAVEILVSARDGVENVATSYAGTVAFSSSDDSAQLPPPYTFTPADQGEHVFTVTFGQTGEQTLDVEDTARTFLRGDTDISVHGGAVINEILYDGVGADAAHVFIELYGQPGFDLEGLTLVAVNGNGFAVYDTIPLTGSIPADGYFVISHPSAAAALAAVSDLQDSDADIQNGPDALMLVRDYGLASETRLDAVAYEGPLPDHGEGNPAPAATPGQSLARLPDGVDTDDNAVDFVLADVPTPGASNGP